MKSVTCDSLLKTSTTQNPAFQLQNRLVLLNSEGECIQTFNQASVEVVDTFD